MSNATQLDALDAELKVHLPEMTFGANRINLKHRPSGWQYEFSTKEALRGVKNGPMEEGDGAVKVKHADEWLKSRCVSDNSILWPPNLTRLNRTNMNTDIPIPDAIPIKSYDWTYTTAYEGHACPESPKVIRFQDADHSNHSHSIPMDELARHDPILFYSQTLLFEDELHDNGSSSLLVRLVSAESIWLRSNWSNAIPTESHAWVHIPAVPTDSTRRSCPIPDIRYPTLPFFSFLTASGHQRDSWFRGPI